MAVWLVLAIVAQFLSAVTVTIDKRLVSRALHIGRPIVLTFYISLLSGFIIVLAPFASVPTMLACGASLASSALFLAGLYFQFSAFQSARVSDVAPVVGAISAITTLVAAGVWIDGDVTLAMVPPILLLAGGAALISRMHFARHSLRNCILAGFCFGLMFFFSKIAYTELGFTSGLFWTRLLNAMLALGLLFIPAVRSLIIHGSRSSTARAKGLVVTSKIVGSLSSVLTALAVSMGSVAAVNALSGLQFVFLFFFALLFSTYIPRLRENGARGHGGKHTALGVGMIVIGFAWLAGAELITGILAHLMFGLLLL